MLTALSLVEPVVQSFGLSSAKVSWINSSPLPPLSATFVGVTLGLTGDFVGVLTGFVGVLAGLVGVGVASSTPGSAVPWPVITRFRNSTLTEFVPLNVPASRPIYFLVDGSLLIESFSRAKRRVPFTEKV